MFTKHLLGLGYRFQSPDGLLHAGSTGSIAPDMNLTGSPQAPNINSAVQASAASLVNVIANGVTYVSGTNAMTGFRLPRGFRGLFCIIPSGACTGATGGTLAYSSDGLTEDIPIGKAFTAVANRALLLVSDGALVYPFA